MSESLANLRTQILDHQQQLSQRFCETFGETALPSLPVEDGKGTVRDLLQRVSEYWLARKNGLIPLRMKELGKLSAEERPRRGAMLNTFKGEVEQLLGDVEGQVKAAELAETAARDRVDIPCLDSPCPMGGCTQLRKSVKRLKISLSRWGIALKTVLKWTPRFTTLTP